MPVCELKVEVAPDSVPELEDFLAEIGDERLMVVEDRIVARAWITGYFDSAAAASVRWAEIAAGCVPGWQGADPVFRTMADADWRESYRAHFKPSAFGPLHWVPVWERDTFALPSGGMVLWLDPGLAFGTGNHETTRLAAERLVEFAEANGTTGRVVDVGCGSGILALSAALLGFEKVDAFDNDAEAIRVSEENAALNGLAGRVTILVGDLESGLAGPAAEVVLANIQADVLVKSAGELLRAVAPGGVLVLSGILAGELAGVREAFADLAPGWSIDSRVKGEWSDLLLTRGNQEN